MAKTIVTKWFIRNSAKQGHKKLYQRGLEARRRNRGRHPRLYAPSVGRTGRRKDIR